uniref:Uncharacterized protein n=1 Tax=Micrurus paraensis TaxID=1970185 RepID=A0A2D4K5G4_9SAUR
MKAVSRGIIISYTAKRNKEKFELRNRIQKTIQKLERDLQEEPQNIKIKEQLIIARHELNIEEQEEMVKNLRRAKQKNFEHANKPGRWLSFKLKKEREKRTIQQLQDEKGIYHSDLEKKKQIIYQYFQGLYKKEEVEEEYIRKYLEKEQTPIITEELKENLNRKITTGEVIQAIRSQKNNKTPGPDGLSGEFYKILEEILSPVMVDLYNEVLTNSSVPETWRDAIISLISKEGTDAKQIQNYRPISLLNSDYKIFATIIANRLKNVLNEYIHEDQNGFLPGDTFEII